MSKMYNMYLLSVGLSVSQSALPSVSRSVLFFGKFNSSEIAKWNFIKLCTYLEKHMLLCTLPGYYEIVNPFLLEISF